MKKKRKRSGSGTACLLYTGILLAFFLVFGIQTFGKFLEEKVLYQSVVSLDGLDTGGDFEKEVRKIQGFCSLTPVIEVPIKLRAEGYTMEVILIGVEPENLEKQVSRSRKVPFGTRPVLLLGEESLAAMTDRNGHEISEEKQREFLERYEEISWQYCSDRESENTEVWNSCLIAAILSFPSENIYVPYSQAEALSGTGRTSKFLLTVRGKDNYERALKYFEKK